MTIIFRRNDEYNYEAEVGLLHLEISSPLDDNGHHLCEITVYGREDFEIFGSEFTDGEIIPVCVSNHVAHFTYNTNCKMIKNETSTFLSFQQQLREALKIGTMRCDYSLCRDCSNDFTLPEQDALRFASDEWLFVGSNREDEELVFILPEPKSAN